MKLLETKSLYYNDVNMIAAPTVIPSRKLIPEEKNRVMVSPMQSVIGPTFAKKALSLGLSVCLHRFDSTLEKRIGLLEEVKSHKYPNDEILKNNLWVSLELKNISNALELINHGAENIIIDIANGYMLGLIDYTKELVTKANGKVKKVMLGNIHSAEMLPYYLGLSQELDLPIYYRCGIASGSACNTKGMTGYNRGQITEIAECAEFSKDHPNLVLVADGGIKDPACASKAFGAGAEFLMMGGYFSYAKESQHVIDEIYKFWGGASEFQQILTNGEATRHSEGKELHIDKTQLTSLDKLVDNLWGGISSAVSYSGYPSLCDFVGNATFEEIK
jgi:GMP reductase